MKEIKKIDVDNSHVPYKEADEIKKLLVKKLRVDKDTIVKIQIDITSLKPINVINTINIYTTSNELTEKKATDIIKESNKHHYYPIKVNIHSLEDYLLELSNNYAKLGLFDKVSRTIKFQDIINNIRSIFHITDITKQRDEVEEILAEAKDVVFENLEDVINNRFNSTQNYQLFEDLNEVLNEKYSCNEEIIKDILINKIKDPTKEVYDYVRYYSLLGIKILKTLKYYSKPTMNIKNDGLRNYIEFKIFPDTDIKGIEKFIREQQKKLDKLNMDSNAISNQKDSLIYYLSKEMKLSSETIQNIMEKHNINHYDYSHISRDSKAFINNFFK